MVTIYFALAKKLEFSLEVMLFQCSVSTIICSPKKEMINACRKGMHDFQEFASGSKSCNFVLYALTKTTENPLTKYAQEHKMHSKITVSLTT